MRLVRTRDTAIAFGALTALWMATSAGAQTAIPIAFDVQVVHGTNEHEKASDPRCDEIKKTLPIQFKTLEEVRREQLTTTLGQARGMNLPSGRRMNLVPISVVDNRLSPEELPDPMIASGAESPLRSPVVDNRLNLLLKMDGLVHTRLQLVSGRPVIVGGEPYQGGKIIIKMTPTFEQPSVPAGSPVIPRHGLQPKSDAP